jgi:hypothetical protein
MKHGSFVLTIIFAAVLTREGISQPAVEWTGGHTFNNNCCYTLGWRFRIEAANVQVAALGVYDDPGNGTGAGLAATHTVAIWHVAGGEPLATAVVPAGVNSYQDGHFRYLNIAPLSLASGTEYIIGASDFGGTVGDWYAYRVGGFTNSPSITWLAPREVSASGLVFPTNEFQNTSPGIFGANFQFSAVPTVPAHTVRMSEVELCWPSETNKFYQIEYVPTLPPSTQTDWQSIAVFEASATNTCRPHRTKTGDLNGFYRVRAASARPRISIRVTENEVCWQSESGRTYQVQYQSALTAFSWQALGATVTGNGGTNCVGDRQHFQEPLRTYRVLALP